MLHPEEHICPTCGAILPAQSVFHQHVTKNHEPTESIKLAAITFPIVGFVTSFLYNVWPGGAPLR